MASPASAGPSNLWRGPLPQSIGQTQPDQHCALFLGSASHCHIVMKSFGDRSENFFPNGWLGGEFDDTTTQVRARFWDT